MKHTFIKILLVFASINFCILGVSGQTEISTRAQLEAISSNLSGNYILKADIDLSGSNWTPLGEFQGTLDGNGYIIRGMNYNSSGTNSVGLFKTSRNATIKKLGFENANIIGRNQVGIIVGNAVATTFEECYVSNSYVKGNDHVGSICGRAQEATVVQNCYSTGKVETNTQSGGLIGVTECSAVLKSYFSGTISATKRANGIVGLVDKTDSFMKVEYCVNLAPSLTASNVVDLYRIIHDGERTMILNQNYSLSTTLIGAPGSQVTRTSNDASSRDGKDLSPADASSQIFYASTLAWDFTNVWTMPAEGYPRLKWQSATQAITVFKPLNSVIINEETVLNLNEYLPTSHGYDLLTFASDNAYVEISEDGILTVKTSNEDVSENVNITFSVKSGYSIAAVDATTVSTNPSTIQIPIKITATPTESNYKLRVSSFNVRNDNSGDANAGNGWASRCPVIVNMILFHDMDIVGTQECKNNQVNDLKNALAPYNYNYIGRGRGANPTDDEYSAIYYKTDKYRLVNSGDFWLSETPDVPSRGWDAALNRICTWGEFEEKATGFRFFAFNLHLDHVGVNARNYGSEVVIEKVRKIANGKPAFLTGDFNVDQSSVGYKIITSSCLIYDSFNLARIMYNPTGTFNSFNNTMVTTQRIDHVFVTDHFTVERYGILTDNLWNNLTGNFTYPDANDDLPSDAKVQDATPRLPSDHYPVIVELKYQEQE